MKQFTLSHLMDGGEIRTIFGILNTQDLTFTEKHYFNGKIYREEIRYCECLNAANYEYDLAIKIYKEKYSVIELS